MTTNRSSFSILPILAAALIAPILACKNANTITAPPTAVNIAGAWTGTFHTAGDAFAHECNLNAVAHATFTQQGSQVDGTLSAALEGCGFDGVAFHGTLDGDNLSGTIQGGGPHYGFEEGSTAIGNLSGTALTLTLENHNQFHHGPIPGGTMRLLR